MRNKSSCLTSPAALVAGSSASSSPCGRSLGEPGTPPGYWLRWSLGAVRTYPSLGGTSGLPEPQCVLPRALVEERWGSRGCLRQHWVIVQSFGRRVLCVHPAMGQEACTANPTGDDIALNSTAWAVLGGHLPALGDVMWAWLPEAALPGAGGPDARLAGDRGDTVS